MENGGLSVSSGYHRIIKGNAPSVPLLSLLETELDKTATNAEIQSRYKFEFLKNSTPFLQIPVSPLFLPSYYWSYIFFKSTVCPFHEVEYVVISCMTKLN